MPTSGDDGSGGTSGPGGGSGTTRSETTDWLERDKERTQELIVDAADLEPTTEAENPETSESE